MHGGWQGALWSWGTVTLPVINSSSPFLFLLLSSCQRSPLRALKFQSHSTVMLSLQSGGERSVYFFFLLLFLVALAALLVQRAHANGRRIIQIPPLCDRGATGVALPPRPDDLHATGSTADSGDPAAVAICDAPAAPPDSAAADEQPHRMPVSVAAAHEQSPSSAGVELASPSRSRRNDGEAAAAQPNGTVASADDSLNSSKPAPTDADQSPRPHDPASSDPGAGPWAAVQSEEPDPKRRLPPLQIRIQAQQPHTSHTTI